MPANLRFAYIAHTLRSDWNNGNAHFLRGLMRSLVAINHDVVIFEPENNWSIANLRTEVQGERSLKDFARNYPDLKISTYTQPDDEDWWASALADREVVILHEWNPPELAQLLLKLRRKLGFLLLFHDTHHRASSTPEQMKRFGLAQFDGVLAFGEALRTIYREPASALAAYGHFTKQQTPPYFALYQAIQKLRMRFGSAIGEKANAQKRSASTTCTPPSTCGTRPDLPFTASDIRMTVCRRVQSPACTTAAICQIWTHLPPMQRQS